MGWISGGGSVRDWSKAGGFRMLRAEGKEGRVKRGRVMGFRKILKEYQMD